MNNHDDDVFKLLNRSGKIEKLRKSLISLILCIEELNIDNNDSSNPGDHLIKKIEVLLNEFALSQKIADSIFINLSVEQRRRLRSMTPEVLDIFGWHDKISETGEIL